MSIMVRRVDLVLNTELLREILRVHVNGFDAYVRREWPTLGEEEDNMYLTFNYN